MSTLSILFYLLPFLPAVLLLAKVYKRDRLDKEPGRLLLKLLLFGAISCLPAALLEVVGSGLVPWYLDDLLVALIENFLIVALAEEACKYIMLRLFTWKREEFDCSFDGVVYAVFVSMGFALLEDVLYIFQNGMVTGLIRGVTALPGHAFFGVFMGIFYGESKAADYEGRSADRAKYTFLALLVPVLAHGAYDFLISVSSVITVIPFVILLAALYILGNLGINRCSAADRYIRPAAPAPWQNVPAWVDPWQNGPASTDPWQNGAASTDPWQNGPAASGSWQNSPAASDPWQNSPAGGTPRTSVQSAAPGYGPGVRQERAGWVCPRCGQQNAGNFCTACGWKHQPDGSQTPWDIPDSRQ